MTNQIILTGSTDYNERFPPRDAKKGYVAKITGRKAGPMKYERHFLGQEATLLAGDEGLYERQRGDKKGGYTRWYHVILSHPEHGLILSVDCEGELAQIAKALDDGLAIQDGVEVVNLRPSERVAGRMIFDAKARTVAAAKKHVAAQTVDTAVEACWQAMCDLPEKDQRNVLAALKARVSPMAKAKAE
jgi:hypothetical protein